MRDPERRSDCRRTVPALSNGDRDVTRADLFNVVAARKRADLIVTEPDSWFAVDDGDRGWCGARFTHDFLQSMRGLQVLRTWQAVRDHGGLERDNRTLLTRRTGDVWSDVKKFAHEQLPPLLRKTQSHVLR